MTVKVDKKDLLSKLKENRKIHIIEFREVLEAYREEAIRQLEEKLKNAKKGHIDLYFNNLNKPSSAEKSYDEAISMVEFSINSHFDLDQRDYKKYVLDEWDWKTSFEHTKTSYGI